MLYDSLSELTVYDLKKIVKLINNARPVTRKADIIEEITRHLLTEDVSLYWAKLNKTEQLIISEALYSWHGFFHSDRFRAKYKQTKPYTISAYLSLFLYNAYIPEDLQVFLKHYVPEPETTKIKTEQKIPEQYLLSGDAIDIKVLNTEAIVRHDLPVVFNLVQQGKISVSEKTSVAGSAALRLLDSALLGGDYYQPEQQQDIANYEGGPIRPIRPYAWPLLLQSSGLAKRTGKKLTLTRKGVKALAMPFAETVKLLYERWRDKGLLDEYSRINLVKGQKAKGRIMTPVAPRRDIIEHILKQCPVGEWLSIDNLFRFVRAANVSLSVCNDNFRLYLEEQGYGTLGYADNAFNVLEGRYILVYCFEYLATLGMIDISYIPPYDARDDYSDLWGASEIQFLSRYDGLLYIRVNALGEYCLDLNRQYQPEQSKIAYLFAINSHLEISLIRTAEPDEEQVLALFASKNQDNDWQFSQSNTLNAIEKGQHSKDFYDFLKQRTEELPDEVQEFFTQQDDKANAFIDGGTGQILHSSSHLIRVITHDSTTKNLCRQIDNRTVIIMDKKEKEFRKALRKLGYLFPVTGKNQL